VLLARLILCDQIYSEFTSGESRGLESGVVAAKTFNIQGDFESCADILITSYWLHAELGKNV
jgi:hypothetical protein